MEVGVIVLAMEGDAVRKYMTEWTIGVTVSARMVARPQDFRLIDMREIDYPCHIYLVTRRPRMSIEPSSVAITDNRVRGILRLQREASWEEFPFESYHRLGPGPLRWVAEWPNENYTIKNDKDEVIAEGVVANLQAQINTWPRAAKEHDIVYIGQAFGQKGERTAWDRLKNHGTVQRILADTPPDKQVWLTLAAITDENLFPEIEPRFPAERSSEEDDEHSELVINAVGSGSFREKEAVALAEAGLIRFFQPEYNNHMKYSFPASKHIALESVRRLDFHGLVVELQAMDIGALYGSSTRKYSSVHFAGFAIHQSNNRAGTIVLEAAYRFSAAFKENPRSDPLSLVHPENIRISQIRQPAGKTCSKVAQSLRWS
jgi:hypothetical protein